MRFPPAVVAVIIFGAVASIAVAAGRSGTAGQRVRPAPQPPLVIPPATPPATTPPAPGPGETDETTALPPPSSAAQNL